MGWSIERSQSHRARCHGCGAPIEDQVRLLYFAKITGKTGQYDRNYYHVTCAGKSLDAVMKVKDWEMLSPTLKEWVKNRMGRK